jgi:hypothetical protein
MTESCEYGNEPSESIKGGEYFDYRSDYWLRKKDLCSMKLDA